MKTPKLFLSLLLVPLFYDVVSADNEILPMIRLVTDYPDWKPSGIIDVGANVGGWSREARKLYPDSKIFMVEAFPEHQDVLKKTVEEIKNAEHRIAVLSESDGKTVKFFRSNSGFTTGNSMFKENSKHYGDDAKFTEHTTATLDTLVAKSSIFQNDHPLDYLKLDVQGAELVVLKGARNVLQKVTFVQLEVSIIEYNQGGACMWEIDELLRMHGFYLYDIADMAKIPQAFHTKAIGQMDVLYVKPTSDGLPIWLKENAVNMCGSSRDTAASMGVASISSKLSSSSPLVSWWLPLLVGFLLGVAVTLSQMKRPNTQQKAL